VSESELYSAIIGEFSHGDCRLFRLNSGLAWQGKIIEQSPTRLVLSYPRPVKLAVAGFSDIAGWSSGGIFTAIEAKSKNGRLSEEQAAFIKTVRMAGGRAGVARSVDEARVIISGRAT